MSTKKVVTMLKNNLPMFRASLKHLKSDVLVGVPNDNAGRKDSDKVGEKGSPMNNATLAYIHDNGSPAANIPARPFMRPGIEAVKDRIAKNLESGARGAMLGEPERVEIGLNKAGLVAQASIRGVINSGIPPALSERTIADRQRRGRTGTVPLIDTGQLRNSVNYIIRKK